MFYFLKSIGESNINPQNLIVQADSANQYIATLQEPIGILGYGVEGKSSLRFLQKHGYQNIQVFDQKEPSDLPPKAVFAGDFKEQIPTNIKTLIRSAGIRWDHPELVAFQKRGGILTSQVELFFDIVPSTNIIGVTGTLGKGTCCTLLHQILKNAHRSVYLGGNIGIPALDLLDHMEKDSLAVLELSSFQLSTLRRSPHIGVILKTTSEHLDWHLSHSEYLECKSHLVRHQKSVDWTVYYQDQPESKEVAQHSPGQFLTIGTQGDIVIERDSWELSQKRFYLKDYAFQAPFFLQNAAAAAAVAQILHVEDPIIQKTCQEFPGLEHRLEFCGKSSKHIFINDSYATRPDATLGALEAFAQKPKGSVGLILGGSEKNADFHALVQQILSQSSIGAIALIGHTAPRFKKLFSDMSQELTMASDSTLLQNISVATDLEEAFAFLLKKVPTGTLLLSPACASFGLFRDYKHRGQCFKQLVKNYLS